MNQRHWMKLVEEQRAEIERLRAVRVIGKSGYEYVSTPEEVSTLLMRLNKENGQLRAALQNIADHKSIMSDWPHTIKAAQRVARAALEAES